MWHWFDNRELDIDMTFIIDNEGFLAGAALYGSEAGTWIDFLTLIINKKISGEELRNMIFAFPTQTYMIVSTLIPLLKKEVSLGNGRYKCPCGYIYDPAKGDPKRDIPAGTKFEDLPDTWRCPRCKRKQEKFEAL